MYTSHYICGRILLLQTKEGIVMRLLNFYESKSYHSASN
nr:MAG TPA: hypothetical protein [Caudoviricetes sp.]